MMIMMTLLLFSLSLLPSMTSSKEAPSTCNPSDVWLKALCATLDNQSCNGRCSGRPSRLDCSCNTNLTFFLTMIKDLIQVSASPEMALNVPRTDVMLGAGSVSKGVCLKGNKKKNHLSKNKRDNLLYYFPLL